MPAVIVRRRIRISGIVQGIGFRPFVYRLARSLQLHGHVLNTSEGVLVEVEGAQDAADRFLLKLVHDHPPLAHIGTVDVSDLAPASEAGFTIRESVGDESQLVLVSPDLATCEDCWRDFSDPKNRRFDYPFTNCTNCGPRYTIIRDIPYDRSMTSMAAFAMCPLCQAEYDDPADRRFHAQPNACPGCGPSLGSSDALPKARRLLGAGGIVAIKGLGGFHLTCDAENEGSVQRLRRRKRRSDKPFAVMAPDLNAIEQFCIVSESDRRALLSVERPIVVLARREGASICRAVAPNNRTLGVMLPYTPLHHLLFAGAAYRALVMTSGNQGEEPIVVQNHDARRQLSGVADAFLPHNRDIYMRVDDSVVRTFEGQTRVLRRARGYAPYPIDLGMECAEVLACGAELKSTFCLTKGRYALLSQHIGDLENYETLEFFQETLEQMKKLFRVEPRVAAYDLHPNYLSTQFALGLEGVDKVGVQHHHAHVAACMVENGLRDRVIGVAFDGTGYGTDGQIWGGEFLIADFAGFERRAHLRYIQMPGGDQTVREPWRAAVSYVVESFGAELPDLPLWSSVPAKKLALVETMVRRRVNTVQTSSCGRLFDAVASLAGLRSDVTYEGQAATELEMAVCPGIEDAYSFDIESSEPWQVDMRAAIRAIVAGLSRGDAPSIISARFHNTIAAVTVEVCRRLRAAEKLNRVCLSGGTFQNVYLLTRVLAGLRGHEFEVFLHSEVPPNDGGLSLGQAAIASRLSHALVART
jgi:hydrogenase maturation protein HypF